MTKRAYPLALTALLLGLNLGMNPAQAANATRNSSFVYDTASGLLMKEVIEPGNPDLCLVTEYQYDTYGNKTTVTTRNCNGTAGEGAAPAAGSDGVIQSRTTSSTYDAKGRFAETTTNALNHTETRTFDERFGGVKTLTGPNGLTTTWTYDGFGRKKLETRADGSTTSWTYTKGGSGYAAQPNIVYYVATYSTGQGRNIFTYYDSLNRKVMTNRINMANNDWIDEENTVYDAWGRVAKVYLPYERANTATAKYTTYTYDILGRVTKETAPDGSLTTKTYAGLTTTVKNSLNQTQVTVKNTQGQTLSVTDAQNKTLSYTYDPFGNLTRTTDALGNVTQLAYDARGRKIGMNDPDMGIWTYAYNALGELIRQIDAKGQTVTMQYDLLGRMTSRNEPDLVSTWEYDTAAHGIGKLATATAANGYTRSHTYDALGRLSSTSTVIDDPANPYVTGTTYDSVGRPLVQTYPASPSHPTGFAVRNVYNAVGYLTQVVNAATPTTVYWTANTLDAMGHLTQQTYGNGITTQQIYNPATGRLEQQLAGAGNAVQNMSYQYDTLGNLSTRTDVNHNLTETYTYDTLNRVTGATATSGTVNVTHTYAYDALGNITSKSDLGSYTYNPSGANSIRPHAVASITGTVNGITNPTFQYDANGNMESGAGRSIVWTSFNIPSQITSQTQNGAKTVGFWYNPEHERTKEQQADGSIVVTLSPRYDTGLHFEKKLISDPATQQPTGAVEYEHYLYAGGQMFGKYVTVTQTDGVTLASAKTTYYSKDHLGSIVAITDEAGVVIQRLSYDVWGKRRYPNGEADPNGLLNNPDMYHGYTGHEMLDEVGLIHMNGRLYDPVTGRFVSADFLIEDPLSLQSYNRYSYVWNNPLTRIDPSGQCWKYTCWIQRPLASVQHAAVNAWHGVWRSDLGQAVIQIGVNYVFGLPGNVAYSAGYTKYQGGSWNDAFKAAVITYATAQAFNAVGDFTGHNPAFGTPEYFQNVAGHALVGCVSTAAGGGSCGSGAMSGGFGAAAAPFVPAGNAGLMASAVIGGTASVLGGGRFANGAVTAAFGYLYNSENLFDAKKTEQCVPGCIQSNYGQSYEVADQLSPLSTVGVATEFVTSKVTGKLGDQLRVNAVRNSYGGKFQFETSQRQFRTLSQFRTFNAGMALVGAGAAGFQIGAQLYCMASCELQ